VKILILSLILVSGQAGAQFGGAVETLQQAGWMNSHHRAYQWHKVEQPRYDAQGEEMRLYRELATEQIRASQGFQYNPVNTQRCVKTLYGVQCQ
jgi:hypothetical protein